MMQDGKRITLSNPLLKTIRLNFRKLIDTAFNEEYEKLTNKIIQLEKTRRNQKDEHIKTQMRTEIKSYREKKNYLNDFYSKSILKCGICNTLEGDRIYYKRFGEWFCPDCYKENIKGWGPSDWEPKYPLSKNQVITFLEELDKVVGQCQTNFDLSKEILTGMDISKSDQRIFLNTLYHYGGHCDCEIMLNAAPNVLADFEIEDED